MTEETEQQRLELKLKLQLDRARSVDLEILERYKGREVVIDVKSLSGAQGGVVSSAGLNLVHLTNCKQYRGTISLLEDNYSLYGQGSGNTSDILNRTIQVSQIEQIVLLSDIINKQRTGDSQ
ncbi:MAG: hypothetical protein NTW17_03715 [Candidatus Pacearchaeota archaeon]|nr:hypothetical protein [Candidatus Pacearchaeota archaeon]